MRYLVTKEEIVALCDEMLLEGYHCGKTPAEEHAEDFLKDKPTVDDNA